MMRRSEAPQRLNIRQAIKPPVKTDQIQLAILRVPVITAGTLAEDEKLSNLPPISGLQPNNEVTSLVLLLRRRVRQSFIRSPRPFAGLSGHGVHSCAKRRSNSMVARRARMKAPRACSKVRGYQFRRNSLEHPGKANMRTARKRGIADAQKELVEARVSRLVRKSTAIQPERIRRRKETDPTLDFLLDVTNSGVVAKVAALPRFNAVVELKLIRRAREAIIVGAQIQVGRASLESEELGFVRMRCPPLDCMALREILRHPGRRHRRQASASGYEDQRPDCEWSSYPW